MPAKNRIKFYAEDSYYHLYNRGVEKRTIFRDKFDFEVFLDYLVTYLLPKDIQALYSILQNPGSSPLDKEKAQKLLRLNNFSESLSLIAFCLMPNHFHLLVKQQDARAIDCFMNSLCTRYTMYFNKRHHRVGSLYQGIYKAVRVETDEQLLHLSRYIHTNPSTISATNLRSYPYSSYLHYLEQQFPHWIHPHEITSQFAQTGPNSYWSFVENKATNEESLRILGNTIIDED